MERRGVGLKCLTPDCPNAHDATTPSRFCEDCQRARALSGHTRRTAARARRTLAFLPALVASDPDRYGRGWELSRLAQERAQHKLMVEAAQRHLATTEDEIRAALARDWSVREIEAAVTATIEQEKTP